MPNTKVCHAESLAFLAPRATTPAYMSGADFNTSGCPTGIAVAEESAVVDILTLENCAMLPDISQRCLNSTNLFCWAVAVGCPVDLIDQPDDRKARVPGENPQNRIKNVTNNMTVNIRCAYTYKHVQKHQNFVYED